MSCFYRPVDDSHPLVAWATGGVEDGSITTAKLAGSAVTTQKIASSAVTTPKIADGAVIASKLYDQAVSTQKIGDGAVTMEKIASGLQSQLSTTFGRIPMVVITDNYRIEYDGNYYVSDILASNTAAQYAYILAPQVTDDVGGVIHDGWVIMLLTTSVNYYGQNKWAGTQYLPLSGGGSGGSGGGGDTFGSTVPAIQDPTGYFVPVIDNMTVFDGVNAGVAVGDYIIVPEIDDTGGAYVEGAGMLRVDSLDTTHPPYTTVALGTKFAPFAKADV